MSTIRFPIAAGEARCVVLRVVGAFRGATVEFDGEELGTFLTRKSLLEGQSFPCADGSLAEVRLIKGWLLPRLNVTFNGVRLQPARSLDSVRIRHAFQAVMVVGAAMTGLGIYWMCLSPGWTSTTLVGVLQVTVGGAFLALGWLTRRRSSIALGLATVLFAVLTLRWLVWSIASEVRVNPIEAALKFALLYWMIRGLIALTSARRCERLAVDRQVADRDQPQSLPSVDQHGGWPAQPTGACRDSEGPAATICRRGNMSGRAVLLSGIFLACAAGIAAGVVALVPPFPWRETLWMATLDWLLLFCAPYLAVLGCSALMHRNRLSLGILFALACLMTGFSAFLLGGNGAWRSPPPNGSGMAVFVAVEFQWCALIPGVAAAALALLPGRRRLKTVRRRNRGRIDTSSTISF